MAVVLEALLPQVLFEVDGDQLVDYVFDLVLAGYLEGLTLLEDSLPSLRQGGRVELEGGAWHLQTLYREGVKLLQIALEHRIAGLAQVPHLEVHL
jgi:hypothetical protein